MRKKQKAFYRDQVRELGKEEALKLEVPKIVRRGKQKDKTRER